MPMSFKGKHKGRAQKPKSLDEDVGMKDVSMSSGPTRGMKRTSSSLSKGGKHRDRQVLLRTDGSKPYGRLQGKPGANRPPVMRAPGGGILSKSSGASKILSNELRSIATDSDMPILRKLRSFLESRWNPDALMLNLEGMVDDPFFKEAGITPPGVKGASKSAAPALWKLCNHMYPNINSLSLASNRLSSIVPISPASLIEFLPNLRALSLANNNIFKSAQLNHLSSSVSSKQGLDQLQEIVLAGNPVYENVKDNTDAQKKLTIDLLRRFPSLSLLNGNQLDTSLRPTDITAKDTAPSAAVATSSGPGPGSTPKSSTSTLNQVIYPLSVKHPGFTDSDDVRDLVGKFLSRYFDLYDNDRSKLESVYTYNMPKSVLTITMIGKQPDRARAQGLNSTSKQRHLDWSKYLRMSRNNYDKKSRARDTADRVYFNTDVIIRQLCMLPKTKHPTNDPSKFVFDAWSLPGVLANNTDAIFLSVHGEFVERPVNGTRSFDRTFILAPAFPGTPAHADNWPCVIVNDQFNLRLYSDAKAWSPDSLPVQQAPSQQLPQQQAQSSQQAPPPQQQQPNGIQPDPQQAAIIELQKQTNLNSQFARQCLEESGWDMSQALNNFAAVRASIPPEAFM